MLWPVTIQTENQDKPTGFQPPTLEAQDGDAVFWVNDDVHAEHQPYPTTGTPTTWCPRPLAGSERSDAVALANAGTIDYLCAIHADETGTIIVANAVDIGRTADNDVLFIPGSLQINVGESVSWSNSDSEAHQPAPVGGSPTAWFPEPIPSGQVSAHVPFDTAGTVPYACVLHPKEKGTIVVPHTVNIAGSGGTASFDPQTASVNANDSVVWQNSDTQPHQPVPDSGAPWFATPIAAGAASAAIAFSSAGSVPYHCKLHPSETGTIDVT